MPEQTISPPAPVPAPPEEAPRAWTLRPSTLAREYHIVQDAHVVATVDSTGPQSDSTSIVVDASVRNVITAAAPTGVAGLIRIVTIGLPGAGRAPLPGITLPYAFSAPEPRPGAQAQPVGRATPADPCASPGQVPLSVLRDVLVRAPESLVLGREWTDSGTYVTCREGVLLGVSSRRQFKLTGYERRGGNGVLLVARSGTTTIRGSSVRGDDTTRVEGSGTSAARYEFDAITGHVLSATGSGSLDVVVRGALKSQRARQTSTLQISLRAP